MNSSRRQQPLSHFIDGKYKSVMCTHTHRRRGGIVGGAQTRVSHTDGENKWIFRASVLNANQQARESTHHSTATATARYICRGSPLLYAENEIRPRIRHAGGASRRLFS